MSGKGKKKKDREEDDETFEDSSAVDGRPMGKRPLGEMIGRNTGPHSTMSGQGEFLGNESITTSLCQTMSALLMEMKSQREQEAQWREDQMRLAAQEAQRRDAELERVCMQAAEERETSLQILELRIKQESETRVAEAKLAREAAEQRHQITEVLRRLSKFEKGEDIVTFLDCFEQSLKLAQVPRNKWGGYVPDYLTGKAKEVFCGSVPVDSRTDYDVIKSVLIESLSKSAGHHVGECFGWVKPFKATPGEVVAKAKASLNRAFSGFEPCSFTVLMMTTLSAYSQECINTILTKKPANTPELVKAISDFEATHGNATKVDKTVNNNQRTYSPPRQPGSTFRRWGRQGDKNTEQGEMSNNSSHSNVPVKVESQGDKRPFVNQGVVCFLCHKPGHKRPDCPLKKESTNEFYQKKALKRVHIDSDCRSVVSGCSNRVPNVVYGTVNEIPSILVVDSGAEISVFNKALVKEDQFTGEILETKAFDGALGCHPIAKVPCSVGGRSFCLPCVAIDMPPEEGGMIGFIDTDTMHELLDFAAVTALRAETQIKVGMTRSATKKAALEEERLAELELVECPKPKNPDQYVEDFSVGVNDTVVSPVDSDMLVDGKVVKEEAASSKDEFQVQEGVCMEVVNVVKSESERLQLEKELQSDDSLAKWRCLANKGENGFFWDDGLLLKAVEDDFGVAQYQVVLATSFRQRVLEAAHDRMGHQSIKKVMKLIYRNFTWPNVYSDTSAYIAQCLTCQLNRKVKPTRAPMVPMPVLSVPFEVVAIDLVGPFPRSRKGYKYVLTAICLASRYPEAEPLRTIEAAEVVERLLEILSRHGWPRQILSDQGSQFTGSLMKGLCVRTGIETVQTTPYHPQTNGVVERFHGTLIPMLRKAVDKQIDWPLHLPLCLFSIRSTVNRSTGFSPFELLLGQNARSPLDLIRLELEDEVRQPVHVQEWLSQLTERLDLIRDAATAQGVQESDYRKEVYDRGTVPRKFSQGDLVLLRTPGMHSKLDIAWEGPYEVIEVLNSVNVRIGLKGANRKKQKVVHINMLVLYVAKEVNVCRMMVVAESDACDMTVGKLAGDEMLADQEKQMSEVLSKWSSVLSATPGESRVLLHSIHTGDNLPVRSSPHSISASKLQGVRAEIAELLRLGIIIPSHSPWSSPIVPVVKPDGSIRVCIDFRKLNSITVPDPYFMPIIDELLMRVAESKYLSKLDMAKGFYQVILDEESRAKTAFVSPAGKFEFVRMPFGLRNAPSTFQRLMDEVLRDCTEFAVPYVDDVLVFSISWEQHLFHVDQVLACLANAGLTAKPEKCAWGRTQLVYLGHVVGEGKMSVPEAKVDKIRHFLRPVDVSQLRSFLGLIGYYRKFIPSFAATARPLYQLIHRDAPRQVSWTEEASAAFCKLTTSLCDVCTLTLPVPSDHFVLQTDASYVGLSGCLSVLRDDVEWPVAFYSRQLRGPETRYTVSEIECLAAVEAISHFLIHLDGRHFTLETDHRALEYLLSARLTNKRLIRWALQLQGLDFVIKHRSGARNANADGLSRQAWEFTKEELIFQGAGVHTENFRELSPRTAPVLPVGDVGRLPEMPHIVTGLPDTER